MNRNFPVTPLPSVAPGSTDFLWSTGIEDTFIGQSDPKTGRTMDEYELTQHYQFWAEDLDRLASLRLRTARYGIPWYRVEPSPGKFDWEWTDKVIAKLVTQHSIEPIIDLMHYGTPLWLEGSFLSPEYPERVAEYARQFARRYRNACYWYTPLNEPRVNAWFAARLGWWPPYRRSWKAFASVLIALSEGIVRTQKAILSEEPGAIFVHVDATDLYIAEDSSLQALADMRQELVFLALDLVQGRVQENHTLFPWLGKHGIGGDKIAWFLKHHVKPHIIGYNMYPMFSEKRLSRTGETISIRNRSCGIDVLARLTRLYHARYGLPVMGTETASTGSAARRVRWIRDSTRAVQALRAEGVPVVGYTYWPLMALFSWAYQQGKKPLENYLVPMGLWDLVPPQGASSVWERRETAAAQAYRDAVTGPIEPLGTLI